MKTCIICKKEIDGQKVKYCSNNCKQKDYHKTKNNNSYFYQTIKGLDRKLKFVELLGGKCNKCGYAKNLASLNFHHINTDEKELRMDMRTLSNSNLQILLKEVTKCQLLCGNCHQEEHHPELDIEFAKKTVKESNLIYKDIKLPKEYKKCGLCDNKVKGNDNIYCSVECLRKAKPSKLDCYTLEEILDLFIKYKSCLKVAEQLNFSDKGLMKWLNTRHNILNIKHIKKILRKRNITI